MPTQQADCPNDASLTAVNDVAGIDSSQKCTFYYPMSWWTGFPPSTGMNIISLSRWFALSWSVFVFLVFRAAKGSSFCPYGQESKLSGFHPEGFEFGVSEDLL